MATRRRRKGFDVVPQEDLTEDEVPDDDEAESEEEEDDDDTGDDDDVGEEDDDASDDADDAVLLELGFDEESQRVNKSNNSIIRRKERGEKHIRWVGMDPEPKYNYVAKLALQKYPSSAQVKVLRWPEGTYCTLAPLAQFDEYSKLVNLIRRTYWKGTDETFRWVILINGRTHCAADKLPLEADPTRMREYRRDFELAAMGQEPEGEDMSRRFNPNQFATSQTNPTSPPQPPAPAPPPPAPVDPYGRPVPPPAAQDAYGRPMPPMPPPPPVDQYGRPVDVYGRPMPHPYMPVSLTGLAFDAYGRPLQPEYPPAPPPAPPPAATRTRRRRRRDEDEDDDEDDRMDAIEDSIEEMRRMIVERSQPAHPPAPPPYYPPPPYSPYPFPPPAPPPQPAPPVDPRLEAIERRQRELDNYAAELAKNARELLQQQQAAVAFPAPPPPPPAPAPVPTDVAQPFNPERLGEIISASIRSAMVENRAPATDPVEDAARSFEKVRTLATAIDGLRRDMSPPSAVPTPQPNPVVMAPSTPSEPRGPTVPFTIFNLGGYRYAVDNATGRAVDFGTSLALNMDNVGNLLKPIGEKFMELARQLKEKNATDEALAKFERVRDAYEDLEREYRSAQLDKEQMQLKIQQLEARFNERIAAVDINQPPAARPAPIPNVAPAPPAPPVMEVTAEPEFVDLTSQPGVVEQPMPEYGLDGQLIEPKPKPEKKRQPMTIQRRNSAYDFARRIKGGAST